MKFLLILSIAVMITGSSAVDTTDNRQLQGRWNPNCNTMALWHPVYTDDWSGGFCSLEITCNSPSYDSAAECCNTNFAGQSANTCYTTAYDDASLWIWSGKVFCITIIIVFTKKNLKTMKMIKPQRRMTNASTATSSVQLHVLIVVAMSTISTFLCCNACVPSLLPQLARLPISYSNSQLIMKRLSTAAAATASTFLQ
jgi:hypothetical protein